MISDRAANFGAAPAFPNTFDFRRFAVFKRESRSVKDTGESAGVVIESKSER